VSRLAILLLLLPLAAGPVWAHGGEPPPPPEPPEDPPAPPQPPPPRPPPLPPKPPYDIPPIDGGQPESTPTTPTPRQPKPPELRQPTPGQKGRATGDSNAWRMFWNYNREDLIGLRGQVRNATTTSGTPTERGAPLGDRQQEVLDALRQRALRDRKLEVRAASLIALGRMGTDDDARTFVRILHRAAEERTLQEAAAVALAILPPIEDAAVKKDVRDYLAHVVQYDRTLPDRARGLCILAAGMRAGHEPMLMLQLTGRAAAGGLGSDEAGTLAFALGLSGHPMAAPELARAAKQGKLGKQKLTDVGRAHATLGLSYVGDAAACRGLVALLGSRRAGEHTRRSAALGLGRVLLHERLDQPTVERITEALVRAIRKDNDLLVKGFSAAALGGVRRTNAREELEEALSDGGRTELKPFVALGLGIWTRRAGEASRRPAQKALVDALEESKEPELTSALCIACGLAHAGDARDTMRKLLTESGNALVRGAAAQGLGLLGEPDPEVIAALEKVLAEGDRSSALPDAALALGLMGRRAAAGELARRLTETSSSVVQGRIIVALGHLGHGAAVDPLLEILNDEQQQTIVREFAAVALGLMGDAREADPLFAVDAWFNYLATTRATNEFIRLY